MDFFRAHGFVAVENFWNETEIKALRIALTKLQQDGRIANVATDGDGESHTDVARNLQLCPLSPEAPIFRSLPFHPRVASAVSQLLTDSDEESVCAYLSQTFWKPARVGLGTGCQTRTCTCYPRVGTRVYAHVCTRACAHACAHVRAPWPCAGWHQDNAYFDVPAARRGTAMWTAVHDATIDNGTLEVATGYSRRWGAMTFWELAQKIYIEVATGYSRRWGAMTFWNLAQKTKKKIEVATGCSRRWDVCIDMRDVHACR